MEPDFVYIYVNDRVACTEPRADRQAYALVPVYMSDPWYAAADAAVANLYMSGEGADIVRAPAVGVQVFLGQDNWGPLVANTRIEDVSFALDYEIGLDITPGSTVVAEWASIVHFTATNTNCCDYGSRIPGVWFWPGTRKILVVDGHGANGNSHTGEWGCDDTLLTLAEGVTSTLRMIMRPDFVFIYVNDQVACTEPRADRRV